MTTRRARLLIRPNIGRGTKETSSDIPTKKIPIATSKYSPRKEVKGNSNLNSKSERNNLTEQVVEELTFDKTQLPPEHFSNGKQLTLTKTDDALHNVKECSVHHGAFSSSEEANTVTQKSAAISENYTTLLNKNRDCTVVLDRNIIHTRKHEELERCSTSDSSDFSSIKDAVIKLSHEKEQKFEGKEVLLDTPQNVHEIEIKNKGSLHSSCSDTDKEKDMVRSKITIVQEGNSLDSSGPSQFPSEDYTLMKTVPQNSVISLSEKKSPNKVYNNEETTKRRNRFTKKPPERGTMTMMDLIFWNPPNNPMSHEKKTNNNTSEEVISVLQAMEEEEEVDNNPNLKDGIALEESSIQTETEELPGPRVMVGPNGDITIDEDSLVIRRTDPEQNASKEVVHEVAECTYNSFRKQRPKHYWTDKETAKFYKALSIVGTDFSLMLNLFPKRNRQELKNKFKREERFNRQLVDRAIRDPQQFDLTAFDDDDDQSEEETRNGKKRTKYSNNKKKYKRKKRVKGKNYFEDDDLSDYDSLIIEPASKSSESVSVRKSTRKRRETNKELPTYSTTQTTKRRQSKSRICKPKKKAENTPTECEYESLEILEIPNENLEVVSEDQSVIVSHSPSTSEPIIYEESHASDVHIRVKETVQDAKLLDICEEQDVNNTKQSNTALQHLNIKTPIIANNVLQTMNSSQSNLAPGQLVLVAGKTNNVNEQIVHVYVVSQPPCAQESLLASQQNNQNIGETLLLQAKDSSNA